MIAANSADDEALILAGSKVPSLVGFLKGYQNFQIIVQTVLATAVGPFATKFLFALNLRCFLHLIFQI
ncbi:MAG: hypothetical protein EBW86_05600 [Rhodobacteraceae bacterium]|nr:hypothetical protein [Paracoccaceae bacterium]